MPFHSGTKHAGAPAARARPPRGVGVREERGVGQAVRLVGLGHAGRSRHAEVAASPGHAAEEGPAYLHPYVLPMNLRGRLCLLAFGSVALGCGGSSSGSTIRRRRRERRDGINRRVARRPRAGRRPTARPEAGPCAAGKISCSGACVDPLTDDGNCGGCGLSCPGGCSTGECTVTLATGSIIDFDVAGSTVYLIDGQPGVAATIEAVQPSSGGRRLTDRLPRSPTTSRKITAGCIRTCRTSRTRTRARAATWRWRRSPEEPSPRSPRCSRRRARSRSTPRRSTGSTATGTWECRPSRPPRPSSSCR